ncbi:MAG: YegS/Rv2252/BmrU family lipid kinase [Clostridia bacterium]|nr:YegS/Rv2252/BmrU family lipid kinase [Clostridia bacterium]
MRHLFILNPAAGRRDITEAIKTAIGKLKISEPYDVFVTDAPRSAEKETERYIRAHCKDYVCVYACGGDGTLSEVVNGIYRSGSRNCAFGVVPVGSGNDFVKSFEIPAERFRDLRLQLRGERIDIDILVAKEISTKKERVSLNIISAGYDAAVAKGQEKFKKLPLVSGSAAYKLSLVKCLFSSMKSYFTVLADDEPFGKTGDGPYLFTIAANGRYYGGGFKASPYSDLCDGYLDLIKIDSISRARFLKLVGKFRAGEYFEGNEDILAYKKCKKMQIVSDSPVDLNLDGEIHKMRNPVVAVKPRAITMILPAEQQM